MRRWRTLFFGTLKSAAEGSGCDWRSSFRVADKAAAPQALPIDQLAEGGMKRSP